MKVRDQKKELLGPAEFVPSEIVAQSDETTFSELGVAPVEMENS